MKRLQHLLSALVALPLVRSRLQVDESTLPTPRGPLVWGDVNFIHTTDIHGWLLGHQHATWPEPNYSANTGDLSSFLNHLRRHALNLGVDLLLIDSGDHHDGTGLVSSPSHADKNGSHPSGGRLVDNFLSKLDYDVLAIGNHELYRYPDALEVALAGPSADYPSDHETGEGFGLWDKENKTRYLTSNVNITLPLEVTGGRKVDRSIGGKYVKFRTLMGRKVTAFGILYNFQSNAEYAFSLDENLTCPKTYDLLYVAIRAYRNTTVQPPLEMIKEPWFLKAIEERPDFFVLAGHMSVNNADSQWPQVLAAIRKAHPDVPVFIFGGHTHVRNCERLDDKSVTFAGGRYMETVGFLSANLTSNEEGGMDIFRRYLDSNRKTFKYHSRVPDEEFDTEEGLSISKQLWDAHASLNLSHVIGHAPQDYFLARYPVTDDRSLLKKLMNDVLPTVVYDDTVLDGSGRRRVYIVNSGSQRFDVFKGPFTVDDQYSMSPFTNDFVQILLPARIAMVIGRKMNDEGASQFAPRQAGRDALVGQVYDQHLAQQRRHYEIQREKELNFAQLAYGQTVFQNELDLDDEEKMYGYVTKDSCGPVGSGDDVVHVPVPHAGTPDYASTTFPDALEDEEEVFVIVLRFFLNDVINAVQKLDASYQKLTREDFKLCGDSTMTINNVWGKYALQCWN